MLKNVSDISKKSTSEMIEYNLVSYFDLGFLDIGAYINIDYTTLGPSGENLSQLKKMPDIRFGTKEVWQGSENWIYETDIVNDNTLSIEVKIDGVVEPNPDIDYLNGRVLVDAGATTVEARYSYKWCNFASTRGSSNFLRFQTDEIRNQEGTSAEIFVPLPTVSFSVPPISSNKFYGLGTGFSQKEVNHNITCEVFAKSDGDTKKIADIIAKQSGYAIPLVCLNDILENDDSPLNYDGTLNTGNSHRQLFGDHPWLDMKIDSISTKYDDYISNNIHKAVLNIKTKAILCGCGC